MKEQAIIPIFIPHMGCPFDCIFCNQGQITARGKPESKEDIIHIIETHLETIEKKGLQNVEIAFYGGSFTGLPIVIQQEYLGIAKKYKDQGRVNGIRISTRPDYINDEILANLKEYGVDLIELGVQSLDEEVLLKSKRGHTREIVYESSELIKRYGFKLGIQLMIGLPGDSHEKSVKSAIETTVISPDVARIYPTIVIKGTGLEALLEKGEYSPLSLDEAVETAKDMYLILKNAGISVIRMGLKSSDNIAEGKAILGSTFHPAFRQLVESLVAREELERQIDANWKAVTFYAKKESLSNMIGNKGSNREYFNMEYPGIVFSFKVDNDLDVGVYKATNLPYSKGKA